MKCVELEYDENGFDKNGVHCATGDYYDPQGFTKIGMHRKTRTNFGLNGYSRDGYDNYGYDREGYNVKGFHRNSIHKLTGTLFAPDGFDNNGYDESGYNIQRFDKNGYKRDGFNERGYDEYGYHINNNYHNMLPVMDNDQFDFSSSKKQRKPDKIQLSKLVLTEQSCHVDKCVSAEFSHDGKHIVSTASDRTIRIWEVSSGFCLRIIINDCNADAKFSPDDRYILALRNNQGIGIWDVASGNLIRHINTDMRFNPSFDFSPSGKYIFTHGFGHPISKTKIIDYKSGDCLLSLDTDGCQIYFSPDEKFIAYANDSYISLLDCSTGKSIKKLTGAPDIVDIIFSEDGRYLISYSAFEYRYPYMLEHLDYFDDIAGTKPLFEEVYEDDDESSDEDAVNRDDSRGLKQEWDLVTGKCISAEFYCEDNKSLLPFDNDERITSLSYSPNGQYAVTSTGDTLKLWNISEECCVGLLGKQCKRVKSAKSIPAILEEELTFDDFISELGHPVDLTKHDYNSFNINCFSVSSDNFYLAIGLHYRRPMFTSDTAKSDTDNYPIHIWNRVKGTCLRKIAGHLDTITSISFVPGSEIIISASDDQTIKLWDMHSDKCLCTLNNEFSRDSLITVSPEGRYVMSFHKHYYKSKSSLVVEADKSLNSDTFDDESKTNGDYVCKWWDLISGECLKERVLNLNDIVVSISFTPDGKFFVTHAINGIERYWDQDSENWLATIHHWEDSEWAVITPEGKYDSSGDGECRYLRWTMGMDSYPVETFKNEFYVPGLLSIMLTT